MRTVLTLTLAATWAAPALAQHHDHHPLPTAAEVLDRSVEAIGGKALREKKSLRRTGKLAVEMAGHAFDARVEEYFTAPNKMHSVLDGEFFSQVLVTDGKHVWEWRPSMSHGELDESASGDEITLLEGGEAEPWLDKAGFLSRDWRALFVKADTVGVADVEGRPAYELALTTPSGREIRQFFDRETGRLVKRVREQDLHGEVMHVEILYQEYREVAGVWSPTRVDATLDSPSMGKGSQVFTYAEFEYDVEVPEGLFDMPDELRARVAAD